MTDTRTDKRHGPACFTALTSASRVTGDLEPYRALELVLDPAHHLGQARGQIGRGPRRQIVDDGAHGRVSAADEVLRVRQRSPSSSRPLG